MICKHFDPITASCAPCCSVCSQRGRCLSKEKTALDARNIRDGQVERKLRYRISTSSLSKN